RPLQVGDDDIPRGPCGLSRSDVLGLRAEGFVITHLEGPTGEEVERTRRHPTAETSVTVCRAVATSTDMGRTTDDGGFAPALDHRRVVVVYRTGVLVVSFGLPMTPGICNAVSFEDPATGAMIVGGSF
ncbi:MAG TPA: hypothetical protein VEK80_04995, partial [Kribbellaceae bacterium]|nr:hypothetical protein [Kribbellaceae bacterium]